jgi:preprotein translocase SecF subunit
LSELDIGEIQVQGFSDPHNAMVRLPPQATEGDTNMQRARAVITRIEPGVTFGRTEAVGPKVSGELFANGLISLGLAMLLVMAYIWIRFDFQFGVGAVLSLFHDAILTLGVFSFFRIEFTLPVIAGLLTVIGYSMNDTVVVFDRMRENFRKFKAMRPADVIDLSINETLSRTLMTIATVLLASLSLYLYGGETMRPFAICMLWWPRIHRSTSPRPRCRCSATGRAGDQRPASWRVARLRPRIRKPANGRKRWAPS